VSARQGWRAEEIDDVEPSLDHHAVLHILGPQRTASGAQRRRDHQRIEDRMVVTLGDAQRLIMRRNVRGNDDPA